MSNKFLKKLKLIKIDVFVYRITIIDILQQADLGFTIQKEQITKDKKKYFITHNGISVHTSFLYSKVYLLKLIKKSGPTIGDCYTHPDYRGKSIFPFVINYIAKEIFLENKRTEVFIVVNKDNLNSIKGIEKAGFRKYASIQTKRWLWFYFDKNIITC
jgi:RimJ/RimL family protein N-acetyltransferase